MTLWRAATAVLAISLVLVLFGGYTLATESGALLEERVSALELLAAEQSAAIVNLQAVVTDQAQQIIQLEDAYFAEAAARAAADTTLQSNIDAEAAARAAADEQFKIKHGRAH